MNQQGKQKVDRAIDCATKKITHHDQWLNLNLYNHSIDRECLHYLIGNLIAKKLKIKSLNLSQNTIGDEGCEEFHNQIFDELQNVDLSNIGIREVGSQFLADTKWTNIKILNLSSNKIGPGGLINLGKAAWLESLRELYLMNNSIGNEGLTGFINKKFPHLEELYLTNNEITTEGLQFLAKAEFPVLNTLNLGKNQISDDGCEVLVTIPLPKLAKLHLNENKIGKEGARKLRRGQWPELTLLYLAKNAIGDGGCRLITQANWKKLDWLCISSNGIGDAGLKWIAKAHWPNLQTLRLSENNFQQKGLKAFSHSHFPKLKSLILEFAKCHGEINKELIKCDFPELKKCKVYDQSRYFYYRYRDQGQSSIEDKQFWNDQFAKAFPETEF